MRIKRFFIADTCQAMKLVRDELGSDATILDSRRVAGGIELIAALDYQAPPAPGKPNSMPEVGLCKAQARVAEVCAKLTARPAGNQRRDRRSFAGGKPARPSLAESITAAQAKPQAGDQTLEVMCFELNGLCELIEVQLSSITRGQLQHQRPQQANLWRRLRRMGLPAELSRPLLGRIVMVGNMYQAWRTLLARLSRAVQTLEQDPFDAGDVLALIGPAGVDKTTTLAKTAVRYVLKYGAQSPALASMGNYRTGAQGQIKTPGRVLNVPVTLVDPDQSLIQALAPLARKRMVLVDTAGLPVSDPALRMQFEILASPSSNVKDYLMMATTSQSQTLRSTYQTYRHCGLAGCILTKLDGADSLGKSMALAIAQCLPVAYLADGPRVSDDLQMARSHQLVSRVVSLQVSGEPSEDAMAELLAGFYQQPTRRAG